tara:strand:+ start:350 stop:460 length:111 start_codon:yes stop_codon:yes gene_type:complete
VPYFRGIPVGFKKNKKIRVPPPPPPPPPNAKHRTPF